MAVRGIQAKEDNIQKLVSLAQQNDKKALSELVVMVSPLVHYQAKSFAECGVEIDDLFQEGMVSVLAAVKSYNSNCGAGFKTYLNTCVRNRLISVIRKQSLKSVLSADTTSLENENNVQDGNLSVEEQLIFQEEYEEIFGYINSQLSPKERETLRLFLSGLSYGQISKRTGTSPKSVDNALQRVRQKLKKYNS